MCPRTPRYPLLNWYPHFLDQRYAPDEQRLLRGLPFDLTSQTDIACHSAMLIVLLCNNHLLWLSDFAVLKFQCANYCFEHICFKLISFKILYLLFLSWKCGEKNFISSQVMLKTKSIIAAIHRLALQNINYDIWSTFGYLKFLKLYQIWCKILIGGWIMPQNKIQYGGCRHIEFVAILKIWPSLNYNLHPRTKFCANISIHNWVVELDEIQDDSRSPCWIFWKLVDDHVSP